MKKLFLLLALFSLLCVGCSEPNDPIDTPQDPTEQPEEKPDDGSEIPDDAYISLNKEVLTFVPDGESVEVKVYSNYEWTLTNNCDWVTASISGGEASEEGAAITLTADLTYDDREGTITFSCGKAKKVLVVSQSFKEAIIADENSVFNVPAEGGNVIINYQTSVECEVIISEEAKSWISLADDTRGLVSESVVLNIAPNNSGAEKSAIIKVVKVEDTSISAEYIITQERNMDYIILYTTTNGETISPYNFGYLTNTYEDGVGMLAFDGSKVTSIGYKAFYDCDSLTSVTIGNGVTSIGSSAFSGCTSLTSITIPDSVTSIGSSAFKNCDSLTSITIPNSVTSIRYEAFYGCTSLASITIPDSVTEIGDWAFYGCTSLASITIPDSVTEIGDCAFYGCTSLTSVTIGNGVTSFGSYAFSDCSSLTSVTIPDSVTSIGSSAFYDCDSLTSVTIGNDVTSIGSYAFYDCDLLTSVTIPDSVTTIGEWAFSGCSSLTSITIPDSITSIGECAFGNCSSLTSITIPESVTEIGEFAFYGCSSLTSVYCKPTTPPSLGNLVFKYYNWNDSAQHNIGCKIYVPTESVNAYKSAEYWSDYKDYIVGYDF